MFSEIRAGICVLGHRSGVETPRLLTAPRPTREGNKYANPNAVDPRPLDWIREFAAEEQTSVLKIAGRGKKIRE
jgi:hypothetical protein